MTIAQIPKVTIRRTDDRGITNAGWLTSRHAFSFGHYQNPANTHYRALCVINDDVIAHGGGFPEHGHNNMEILTWVLDGVLQHGDSMGHMQSLRHGELQVMSAGRGIRHSEMNASDVDPVHLLQIWISPSSEEIEPRYSQKTFKAENRQNQWDTVASGRHRPTALPIHQDAELRIADLETGSSLEVGTLEGRYAYIHVAYGSVEVNGIELGSGDAITYAGAANLIINAWKPSEILWFDLP